MQGRKSVLAYIYGWRVDPCPQSSLPLLVICSIEISSRFVDKARIFQDEVTDDFNRLVHVLVRREVNGRHPVPIMDLHDIKIVSDRLQVTLKLRESHVLDVPENKLLNFSRFAADL